MFFHVCVLGHLSSSAWKRGAEEDAGVAAVAIAAELARQVEPLQRILGRAGLVYRHVTVRVLLTALNLFDLR